MCHGTDRHALQLLLLLDRVADGLSRRFVVTSSCIAVQIHDKPLEHVFTEDDWNTWSTVENGDAYGYAKTQAEKLVWACVNNPEGCLFDAVSINPGIVLGEVLCKMHTKSSAVLLRQAIYNNPVLNYPASFVDVKDVARMHVRSLQIAAAGGRRFIATCDHDPMNTVELSKIAQRLLPQYKLQSEPMYPPFKWALAKTVHYATLGKLVLNEFQIRTMEHPIKFSNAAAKSVLNMNFRILGDTIVDTVSSMIDKKFIPPILRKSGEEKDESFFGSIFETCRRS